MTNISNLEKQVLVAMYDDYKKTGNIKHWKLPESFKHFGIKDNQYIGTLDDSIYIGKSMEGTHQAWHITNEGIRFMDSLESSKSKKEWKTKSKDDKYWARAQQDGKNVHIFVGEKGEEDKVHIINDLVTGEIRIDKDDKEPSDLVEEITTYIKLKHSGGKAIKVVKGKISFEGDPNQTTFTIHPEVFRINIEEEIKEVNEKIDAVRAELSDPKLDGNTELSKALAAINPNFFQPSRGSLNNYHKELETYKDELIKAVQDILFIKCSVDSSKYDEKVDIQLELKGTTMDSSSELRFNDMPTRPVSFQDALTSSYGNSGLVRMPSTYQDHEPPFRTNIYLEKHGFGCSLRYIKPGQFPSALPMGGILRDTSLPIIIEGSINSQSSNGDYHLMVEINQSDIKEIKYKDLINWIKG